LVEGLAGECEQWIQTIENLDTQYEFLLGDCILAAGFISYMGPFISTYRDELVKSWKKCVMLSFICICHVILIILYNRVLLVTQNEYQITSYENGHAMTLAFCSWVFPFKEAFIHAVGHAVST
jgi:hypothetical protein